MTEKHEVEVMIRDCLDLIENVEHESRLEEGQNLKKAHEHLTEAVVYLLRAAAILPPIPGYPERPILEEEHRIMIKKIEDQQEKSKVEFVDWTDRHITSITKYIAWDETAANIIGVYDTPEEAKSALVTYACELEYSRKRNEQWEQLRKRWWKEGG